MFSFTKENVDKLSIIALAVESAIKLAELDISLLYTAHWSKAIVGGTPKIRHRFAYFLDLKARNL